jgi:hypothetical protein
LELVRGNLPKLLDFRYEISNSVGCLDVIESIFSWHLHDVWKVIVLFENGIETVKCRLHPVSVISKTPFGAISYLSSIDAIKKTITFGIYRPKLCHDCAMDFINRSKSLLLFVSSVTRWKRCNGPCCTGYGLINYLAVIEVNTLSSMASYLDPPCLLRGKTRRTRRAGSE